MTFDIFQVDWIFVDTLIVIFLIVILISVKIFKEVYRWRITISNENLRQIKVKPSQLNITGLNPTIKKWTVTYMERTEDILPTIFIFRTYRKYMLLNAITEGLSSYGFNVINIWFNNFQRNAPNLKQKDLDSILHYHEDISLSDKYFVQCVSKLNKFSNNSENEFLKGLILINTKLNKNKFEAIQSILEKNLTLYLIYSEYLLLKIKRRHIKKFQKTFSKSDNLNLNILTIDNSKSSFKYYETILLGKIINIVKNSNH